MKEAEMRSLVLATLESMAPEVDAAALHPDEPLRDQVDLDSYDWLRYLVALHDQLKVEIPEADYGQLTTVNRLVAYLLSKTGNSAAG